MSKAIIACWECPSCGNIIKCDEVLVKNKSSNTHSFNGPSKCGCGRKGQFTLLSFEPATALITPDTELKEEE